MCEFSENWRRKEKDCKSCECPDSIVQHTPDENGVCTECGQRRL